MSMTCEAAREAMLEADLAELDATSGSELARHLSMCAECRAIAQRLLDGYTDLERGLATLAPRPQGRSRRRRWLRWTPLPLAAAAVMALVLARREEPLPTPNPLLAQLMFPEQAVVTPPAGKQAVVIEKSDLTVVWLY